MSTHLVIPDTQVKPGVPMDHLRWIGQYLVDKRPDTVVHLGDHWDFPSLSSYDKGKKAMEGRRYEDDVEAGNLGMEILTSPLNFLLHDEKAGGVRKAKRYDPRLVLLRGNHEHRLNRAIEDNAQLDGALSFDDLESPGWEVHDFLDRVEIEGVHYSHYFANPMSGRPYGGQAITRLKTLGHSFVQGHQQVLELATRYVAGRKQTGIVAGASYLHDEDYLGPQGNFHWRGVLMLHEVENGSFDIMEVSLGYLCRRYEGVALPTFLGKKYPRMTGALWSHH